MTANILWFRETGLDDVESFGGKNASLGEMIRQLAAKGVRVPGGFATTSVTRNCAGSQSWMTPHERPALALRPAPRG